MENAIAKNTAELEQLEGVIERGLSTFYEVGRALMIIRDEQLYEKVRGFTTFENYCNERWGFSASRARQLVAAAETYDALKTVTNVTPINEGQTRPLMSLTTEKKQQVWQKAVETAPEGKVTAAHVSKVVKEITGEQPKPYIIKHNEPIIKQELISEDFQLAYDAMIIELKNARATKWKDTSYKGALEMMRTLVTITEQMGR